MYSKSLIANVLIGFVLLAAVSASAAVPQLISYQGRLTNAGGSPVADGPYLIKFIIWDDPVATAAPNDKWNSGFQNVTVTDGLFSYALGSNVPIPDDLFSDTLRWLGITVGVDPEMSPRTKITSEAFAYKSLRADSAGTLGGQSPSYYLAWSNLTGVPAGFADGVDDDAGGDITSVGAGSGLSGGGSSGAVTLNVATGGITSTHIQDETILESDLSFTPGDITGVTAGTGLTGGGTSGSVTLSIDPSVGDITAVNAGTDLSGGGSAGAVTLNLASTLSATHTFDNTTYFGDSTMIVNNTGIRIGDNSFPSVQDLVRAQRYYNTGSSRYGCYIDLYNESSASTGTLFGLASYVDNLPTSSRTQYAVFAVGGSPAKTAGTSYGVRSFGYAGAGAIGYGIFSSASGAGLNYAGYFQGNVHVAGALSKSSGAFRIDHPLDPANKYLQHSFVESPDMMNIYNGNTALDGNGESVVTMPEYFAVLNMDFRYQLTAVGAPGPNLYIAEKINGNQFRIGGGEPFGEVSWQVTGIRNDKYAQAHRIRVEIDKPAHELGLYLNPVEHGQPIERHVNWEQIKQEQEHGSADRLNQKDN